MWSWKPSTCCQASQTLWKLPKANGFRFTSSVSVFVAASTSHASGTTKNTPKHEQHERAQGERDAAPGAVGG